MNNKNQIAQQYAEFTTVTCLQWHPLLKEDRFKKIIIDSLEYLVRSARIHVFAFVIMDNHFHLIWQMVGNHKRSNVQRDFLKFTAQQIIKVLRSDNISIDHLKSTANDRAYQIWERNSLSIPVWSDAVIWQKINYIHNNPVKAKLCDEIEDYHFSSARFYTQHENHWHFLTHVDG